MKLLLATIFSLSLVSAHAQSELNKQLKQFDANSRQISNAQSVIGNMPEDKVNETFDQLPKETKDTVYKMVPKETWDKFTPKQKKEVLNDLMYTASNKLAEQRIATQQQAIQWRHEEAERRNNIAIFKALASRDRGDETADSKVYKQYDTNVRTANAGLAREQTIIYKDLEKAKEALELFKKELIV